MAMSQMSNSSLSAAVRQHPRTVQGRIEMGFYVNHIFRDDETSNYKIFDQQDLGIEDGELVFAHKDSLWYPRKDAIVRSPLGFTTFEGRKKLQGTFKVTAEYKLLGVAEQTKTVNRNVFGLTSSGGDLRATAQLFGTKTILHTGLASKEYNIRVGDMIEWEAPPTDPGGLAKYIESRIPWGPNVGRHNKLLGITRPRNLLFHDAMSEALKRMESERGETGVLESEPKEFYAKYYADYPDTKPDSMLAEYAVHAIYGVFAEAYRHGYNAGLLQPNATQQMSKGAIGLETGDGSSIKDVAKLLRDDEEVRKVLEDTNNSKRALTELATRRHVGEALEQARPGERFEILIFPLGLQGL